VITSQWGLGGVVYPLSGKRAHILKPGLAREPNMTVSPHQCQAVLACTMLLAAAPVLMADERKCKLTVVVKEPDRAGGNANKEDCDEPDLKVKGKQEFVLKDAAKKDIALKVKDLRLLREADRRFPESYSIHIQYCF